MTKQAKERNANPTSSTKGLLDEEKFLIGAPRSMMFIGNGIDSELVYEVNINLTRYHLGVSLLLETESGRKKDLACPFVD